MKTCGCVLICLVLLNAVGAKEDNRDWVALDIDLPKPPNESFMAPSEPRPAPWQVLAPRGVRNVAHGKLVTSSDRNPKGSLSLITDGDRDLLHETPNEKPNFVELADGLQWVQIDLGDRYEIHDVLIWHCKIRDQAHVFHNVVVQVADDADFTVNVRTLFNNDRKNESGLGVGKDREYKEEHTPLAVEAYGTMGRYVRCYSKGNSLNSSGANDSLSRGNYYREIEVWALPVK